MDLKHQKLQKISKIKKKYFIYINAETKGH